MTTSVAGPFNLIQGAATTIKSTTWPSPNQAGQIVLSNNSASTVVVNSSAGTKYLYANSSDVFTSAGQDIICTPIPVGTSQPLNTLIGTLTCTYYSSDEQPLVGYPQALTPFPGGSTLIWGVSVAQPLPPIGSTSMAIAVLPGSGSVSIQATNYTGTPGNFRVIGVQSGITYGTLPVTANGLYSIPLAPTLRDTSVYLSSDITTRYLVTAVYEQPGMPVPTVPNLVTELTSVANGGQVLPALTSGAYYISSWDARVAAIDTARLTDGLGDFTDSVYCSAANETLGSVPLNMHRTPGPVTYTATNVNQNAYIAVRYAVGP